MKRIIILMLVIAAIFTGCMPAEEPGADKINTEVDVEPEEVIPEELKRNDEGVPVLKVYVTDKEKIETMDLETYLRGVVAGEMKNDWPIEALKAQAILARTFTLKFLESKESSYDGANISTDISEAQAYNADKINDRVIQAVDETRGIVMLYDDELPQAWFHAHSGGVTELPTVALDYKEDPEYLSVASSYDSDKAPDDVKNWTASFTAAQVGEASAKCGVTTGACETFEIGEKGESGRAKTFIINGKEVSAPTFRINIGASEMKSTLIESIDVAGGKVVIKGRGYGHGVGMSQWGAYGLAESGATAQSIVGHYFDDVDFVGLW
jgi:stage II sporulation protein D